MYTLLDARLVLLTLVSIFYVTLHHKTTNKSPDIYF